MGKSLDRAINDQQQLFVERYTIHFNSTKAAIEAGYSEKSARKLGYDLLNNPLLKQEIDKILELNATKHSALRYRVVKQLENLAFANMKNYGKSHAAYGFEMKSLDELTDDEASAIQEIRVTTKVYKGETETVTNFKLCSKEKALDLLAKHLGIVNEQPQVQVRVWNEEIKALPMETLKQIARSKPED